jgi:hypothetical protein
MEQKEKTIIGKKFGNTLNDLGFKGEIKKLFFSTSKDAVIFRNFIPKTIVKNFGINPEKLKEQISKLKKL